MKLSELIEQLDNLAIDWDESDPEVVFVLDDSWDRAVRVNGIALELMEIDDPCWAYVTPLNGEDFLEQDQELTRPVVAALTLYCDQGQSFTPIDTHDFQAYVDAHG